MEGINGTLFVYGQTSSGKTYTMIGDENCPGIIYYSLREVFDYISQTENREFFLRVSYMEIYNESIADMLNPTHTNLQIHEKKKKVFVRYLTENDVTGIDEISNLIKLGEKNRHFGCTDMNAKSSRSHTIFTLAIESREKGAEMTKVTHLILAELAGHEKPAATGSEGIHFREGGCINKSLLALSNVIYKLSEDPERKFVPYRDSKLTRILQTSLGGNGRTAIICTVTTASNEATLSSLKQKSKEPVMEIQMGKDKMEQLLEEPRTADEKLQMAAILKEKSSAIEMLEGQLEDMQRVVFTKDSLLKENEELVSNLQKELVRKNYELEVVKTREELLPNEIAELKVQLAKVLASTEQLRKEHGDVVERHQTNFHDDLNRNNVELETQKSIVSELQKKLDDMILSKEALSEDYKGEIDKLQKTLEKRNLEDMEKELSSDMEYTKQNQGSRRTRCGYCVPCKTPNCGVCTACENMTQFGGKGDRRKCCLRRRCPNLDYRRQHPPT